jgi:S-layer homology domain
MNARLITQIKVLFLAAAIAILTITSTQIRADTGTCSGQMITLPFTDVPSSNIFFCVIAEAYFSGLTSGTTATTYSPSANVTRDQMAAFVTRTMDQSLKRGSRRAALNQYWTPASANDLRQTTVGTAPNLIRCDGADIWVANFGGTVSRVRASDGKLLETWTGATNAAGVVVAEGFVFVIGQTTPGKLYLIDPTQPAGTVTTLTSSLAANPRDIAFDGSRIWATGGGGVSIVTLNPLSVTNVVTGFITPHGILYDGANIWVTDTGDQKLKKLDSDGAILQQVSVGGFPGHIVFDGTNIWVPNANSQTMTVVRASTGAVLATLSGNGMITPWSVAFDGERILVTDMTEDVGDGVSLWKAADFSPLGFVSTGANSAPLGACSDGLNFWVTLNATNNLVRF